MQDIKWEMNHFSKADSSVFFKQGGNAVAVSVDILEPNENVPQPNLELTFVHASATPSAADRQKGNIIKETIETVVLDCMIPNSSISITVQEIEDAAGLLSCALNAACLTLLNAGVSMQCTFAALTCAVDANGAVVLDPTAEQLVDSTGQMHFVFGNNDKALITCGVDGTITDNDLHEALYRSKEACDEIFRNYGVTN